MSWSVKGVPVINRTSLNIPTITCPVNMKIGQLRNPTQRGRDDFPVIVGFMFAHCDVAAPFLPLYLKLISASSSFWQGTPLPQPSFSASGVADVPQMSLKLTSEILTFVGMCG
ncbi:hypothetical protein ACJRO7_006524 [Eucalyptus globulus]|uniref:Uncharacterized protein n=1 Tax=Eucalyptus globulus TaxID=34317 RepID=A0ABD3IMI6_EUCGL